MKKIIIILAFFVVACSKPLSTRDKAVQSAQAYLKITDTLKVEFSKLDSVIDYSETILRQLAEIQRQLMIKQDTLKNKKLYDSLVAAPKTKYYIINYANKSTNDTKMLVMDTAFKIISTNNN